MKANILKRKLLKRSVLTRNRETESLLSLSKIRPKTNATVEIKNVWKIMKNFNN